MKKELSIFIAVTAVALIVAAVGHAVNPAICMAIKPMSWPFLAIAYLFGRRVYLKRRKDR